MEDTKKMLCLLWFLPNHCDQNANYVRTKNLQKSKKTSLLHQLSKKQKLHGAYHRTFKRSNRYQILYGFLKRSIKLRMIALIYILIVLSFLMDLCISRFYRKYTLGINYRQHKMEKDIGIQKKKPPLYIGTTLTLLLINTMLLIINIFICIFKIQLYNDYIYYC